MKTLLYFNCDMGADAGRILSALAELFEEKEQVIRKLNRLSLPGITYEVPPNESGHQTNVKVHGESTRYSFRDIKNWIFDIDVEKSVKQDVINILEWIVKAESHTFGIDIGQAEALKNKTSVMTAEVIAVCVFMNRLSPDMIASSPLRLGMEDAAAAFLLQDIPVYGGRGDEKLCTLSGAAILKYYVTEFGDMPKMILKRVGYGMLQAGSGGSKEETQQKYCLGAYFGCLAHPNEEYQNAEYPSEKHPMEDYISEIQTNLDDMLPEDIGYATGLLMEKGALDVYTVPIGMKKNRPGVLLSCICREEDEEKMAELILKHTTSLGVRVTKVKRYTMNRKSMVKSTRYGEIRYKEAEYHGIKKIKPEYEDLKRIAEEKNISLYEVRRNIMISG